ncbi:MAG TPA: SDR family NAD(P)-dependent oxidoreductase [Polyangiaceae bacterium]|nr:SDR family NAD(P)-dependent oxidoreductase [Polyangiaceae bacterium]
MAKVAIVTGANQGLGFALVEGLCRALGEDASVYLTARDAARGNAAREQLLAAGLEPIVHQLDVTSEASVQNFAELLGSKHGGVDIVISNAAARISKSTPQAQQVRTFIQTNNHGTHRVIRHFAPLLREGARFIVVASSFGSLRNLPPAHHAEFDVASRSLEEIEVTLDQYVALVESGRHAQAHWPEWINIPSKVGQVAAMKIFARSFEREARARDILINAVCPGLIDTEASRPWFDDMSSAQTPAQAAVDVLWLATLAPGTSQPYGELVRHRQPVPWS